MKRNVFKRFILLTIGILFYSIVFSQSIFYVDIEKPYDSTATGLTWNDAFTHLQDALSAAKQNPNIGEIWVANGTYYPDWDPNMGPQGDYSGDITVSFELVTNVKLIGGFEGGENSLDDRVDWRQSETRLSGNINTIGSHYDDSFLLINSINVENTTINGFYLSDSHLHTPGGLLTGGQCIYFKNSSGTLENCIIEDHLDIQYSGVRIIESVLSVSNVTFQNNEGFGSAPVSCGSSIVQFTDCYFTKNILKSDGNMVGGIASANSNINVYNCVFENNEGWKNISIEEKSHYDTQDNTVVIQDCKFYQTDPTASLNTANIGIIMESDQNYSLQVQILNCIFDGRNQPESTGISILSNNNSKIDIVNCSFYGNEIGVWGSILENSQVNIYNSILWDSGNANDIFLDPLTDNDFFVSHCDLNNSSPYLNSNNNISIDPLFSYPLNQDFHISNISPCKNAGLNIVPNVILPEYDFEGDNRIIGDTIDIGADESKMIIHVDENCPCPVILQNGVSWNSAYNDLQDALDEAGPDYEIWVADGTYYPSVGPWFTSIEDHIEFYGGLDVPENIRQNTFQLHDGFSLYGGFAGYNILNAGELERDERDWETNITTLSGYIDNSLNSHHVVFCGIINDPPAILDGFNVVDSDITNHSGSSGALFSDGSNLSIDNCTFKNNINHGMCIISCFQHNISINNCTIKDNILLANKSQGCGVWVSTHPFAGELVISNSLFLDNYCNGDGGGLYIMDGENVKINNCIFSKNQAKYGGGIHIGREVGSGYNNINATSILNCSFSNNTATYYGNSIYLEDELSPTLTNSILWNTPNVSDQIYATLGASLIVSHSDIQGGYTGTNNQNEDPLYYAPNSNDLHLKSLYGRWYPPTKTFVKDNEHSEYCIDMGIEYDEANPESHYDNEIKDNGYRINMGAYGNTAEASKSPYFKSRLIASLQNNSKEEAINISLNPNPFKQNLNIDILSKDNNFIDISVYNIMGIKVRSIFTGSSKRGNTKYNWDGTNDFNSTLPNGIYFVRFNSSNESLSKTVILQK